MNRRRTNVANDLKKFGPALKQAEEMPLELMHVSPKLTRAAPLHMGGLQCPVLSVLVISLLMLRGIAARSLLRVQVMVKERV